MLDKDNINEY